MSHHLYLNRAETAKNKKALSFQELLQMVIEGMNILYGGITQNLKHPTSIYLFAVLN